VVGIKNGLPLFTFKTEGIEVNARISAHLQK